MGKASAWVLYVIVFLAGSVVMAFEIKASKVMAPYFGSDVYTWGNIIGVILLAMSLGYYLGGRAA
jgi:predicted membrane-bound spermidine synthase